MSESLIRAENLSVTYSLKRPLFWQKESKIQAVHNVSLEVGRNQVVSIVGESGCGKSTLGAALMGLVASTGTLYFEDQLLNISKFASWDSYRKKMQIVFQDPASSLNPRRTLFEILASPLLVHKIVKRKELDDKISELLLSVGLSPDYKYRYPHQFSGGQKQRINLARALSLEPSLLICDEIVAALDVSVQAQMITLLQDLKEKRELSLLFISHDLSLIKVISDIVYVMYAGQIVERASADKLFRSPMHPYTRALMDAIPTLSRSQRPAVLKGESSQVHGEQGCPFASRCPIKKGDCSCNIPPLIKKEEHAVACFHPIL